MKKLTGLFAALAIATAANAVSAETWCMPGSYQGEWKLDINHFEANGDGSYTQTIPNLFGEFKIVRVDDNDFNNWTNQWGSNNDNPIGENEVYNAVKLDNTDGKNIKLAGDNLHYINAKVTITPGEENALTIKIEAEHTETRVWCMPGSYQGWSLNANIFKSESDGSYTQTIPDLYGDFKIVRIEDYSSEDNKWKNAWGSNNDNPIGENEVYNAVKLDNTNGTYGNNIQLAGDNLHYINAKVTITPGEDNALTIKIEAERTEEEDLWCMPGTYQGWKLETNRFTANGDGSYTQTIPCLYGDFKIVRTAKTYPKWDNAWGAAVETTDGKTVDKKIKDNEEYQATKGGNNIYFERGNYVNAKVTITPGASDALTIKIVAERVEDTWHLVGAEPLVWDFKDAYQFEKGDGNVWTLGYIGTITSDFKVVKNRSWDNAYSYSDSDSNSTEITLDTNYTISKGGDNMKPASGPWVNPKFKVVDNGDAGVVLYVSIQDPAGIEAVEAEPVKGEAVYFNLQGQRVANPERGLYIRLQGGKATKVAL